MLRPILNDIRKSRDAEQLIQEGELIGELKGKK
jgi:hypothetical protein